jgi:hypothetical protein
MPFSICCVVVRDCLAIEATPKPMTNKFSRNPMKEAVGVLLRCLSDTLLTCLGCKLQALHFVCGRNAVSGEPAAVHFQRV